jgi:transposase
MASHITPPLYPAAVCPLPVLTSARARELLQHTVSQIREGTFPYQSRPLPRRDWSLYDRAATHEARDLLDLLGSVTETLAERVPLWAEVPADHIGRDPIVTLDRVRGLLWQSYRDVANRPAASELGLLARELGVVRSYSYSTVARAYHDPEVLLALRTLLWLTNEPVMGEERGFAIDGSGFPTAVAHHYASSRGRQRGAEREAGAFPSAPHPWVRNVANIGLDYQLIAGWKSWTDSTKGELSAFEEVFRMTAALHPGAKIQLGDGLYAVRWVVGEVAEAGMEARVLPRRDVTLKCLGEPAWPKSLWGLVKDPQAWLEEYHLRSRVEAFWGAIKARNPSKVRKRVAHAQVVEATLRAVVYNLRRLCYWKWVSGLDPVPDGVGLLPAEA